MSEPGGTLSSYAQAAEYYDLLHASGKDYAAEAGVVADLIRAVIPDARRVLDVACGTGRHAEALAALAFAVDGIDLEPQFVAAAAVRNPDGRFQVADMITLDLSDRYDAVVCLFSAIGYVRTVDALNATLERMAAHLSPSGVVIIDPWFEPGQLTHRHVEASTSTADGVAVCRLSRTFIDGTTSHLEFEYLIGTADRVERAAEIHTLGLFTQAEIESAFRGAGLDVERKRGVLRKRGVYLGTRR